MLQLQLRNSMVTGELRSQEKRSAPPPISDMHCNIDDSLIFLAAQLRHPGISVGFHPRLLLLWIGREHIKICNL